MTGDLNGRVGRKPDYISFDANINGLNSADYTPDVAGLRRSNVKNTKCTDSRFVQVYGITYVTGDTIIVKRVHSPLLVIMAVV